MKQLVYSINNKFRLGINKKSKRINVSVELTKYRPIEINDLIREINNKETLRKDKDYCNSLAISKVV